jgi:NAD(P)-dependent dehydrogenase (short-subunit alcohol dehydrogenase family)
MTEAFISQIDLAGQVALVTGGGRGLGRAMAQSLAAAGAAVAVIARTQEQLTETVAAIRMAGGEALAFNTEITDPQAVTSMAQRVQKELGAVDILVNNAGRTGVPGPIWQIDPDDWRATFGVNVDGAFLCSAAILPTMIERHRGRIINVASGAALGPIPYGSQYCVSKAALARLTECINSDAKEYGITAFSIDPGSVRTAMTEYLIESDAGRTYLPWYREYILAGNDVPSELSAQLVVKLASGKYDSLSGRFLSIRDNLDLIAQEAKDVAEQDLN